MRLLILTPQLPYPPQQGTTLRNFYLLRELSRRHDVSLLTFMESGDELRDDSPLRSLCRAIVTVPAPPRRSLAQRAITTLASPQPDMALRLASDAMTRALRDWLAREAFDVIQVEGIEMAGYGLVLTSPSSEDVIASGAKQSPARTEIASTQTARLAMTPKIRLVFDDHNAEYVLQRSAFEADARIPTRWHGALYSFVQWQKLARYERRVLRAHHAVAAVSQMDADALQQIAPERKIFVVPNGVDTDEFAPQEDVAGVQLLPQLTRDSAGVQLPHQQLFDLVFTGKMDYRPNIDAALWFAHDILPRVRAQIPNARFVVVGQQPHARLAPLTNRADVVLTGWVQDVRPYIAGATLYVAPLRMGGGTRFKVLQAMSMAVPIVSTTLGCSGLAVQSGRDVLLADTPNDFADAIIRVARDESLRRQLGDHARQLAVARYDWRHIAPLMEALYQ